MITLNVTGNCTINGDPEFQQQVLSELTAIRTILEKGGFMSAAVLSDLTALVTRLRAAIDKLGAADPNGMTADEVTQLKIPLQTAVDIAEAKVPK